MKRAADDFAVIRERISELKPAADHNDEKWHSAWRACICLTNIDCAKLETLSLAQLESIIQAYGGRSLDPSWTQH